MSPTFDTTMLAQTIHISGGARPEVYVATRVRGRQENAELESGSLTFLNLQGRPEYAFSFADHVAVGEKSYGPPWALTAFAVNETSDPYRVAVTAHHYMSLRHEFTASALDFVSARFSDRYWELHQRLESEGKIAHSRDQCPDRNGPREILEWAPATGRQVIGVKAQGSSAATRGTPGQS